MGSFTLGERTSSLRDLPKPFVENPFEVHELPSSSATNKDLSLNQATSQNPSPSPFVTYLPDALTVSVGAQLSPSSLQQLMGSPSSSQDRDEHIQQQGSTKPNTPSLYTNSRASSFRANSRNSTIDLKKMQAPSTPPSPPAPLLPLVERIGGGGNVGSIKPPLLPKPRKLSAPSDGKDNFKMALDGRTMDLKTAQGTRGSAASIATTGTGSSVASEWGLRDRVERAKKMLRQFFKTRPSLESVQAKGIIPTNLVFGGPLEANVLDPQTTLVPLIVRQCVQRVEQGGMDHVGVYRLSGNAAKIQKLRLAYNEDPRKVDLTGELWRDLNVITGTLKLYLRELQNPLLTFERYEAFVTAAKIPDIAIRKRTLRMVIQSLPETHLHTFAYLCQHLYRISQHASENKMDVGNLAIVFGPTLVRAPQETMETIQNLGILNNAMELIFGNVELMFGKDLLCQVQLAGS